MLKPWRQHANKNRSRFFMSASSWPASFPPYLSCSSLFTANRSRTAFCFGLFVACPSRQPEQLVQVLQLPPRGRGGGVLWVNLSLATVVHHTDTIWIDQRCTYSFLALLWRNTCLGLLLNKVKLQYMNMSTVCHRISLSRLLYKHLESLTFQGTREIHIFSIKFWDVCQVY